MWFVFCPVSGEAMRVLREGNDIGTVEFENAAGAASLAARFMTELDPGDKLNELHVVNLEKGVTLVITKKYEPRTIPSVEGTLAP